MISCVTATHPCNHGNEASCGWQTVGLLDHEFCLEPVSAQNLPVNLNFRHCTSRSRGVHGVICRRFIFSILIQFPPSTLQAWVLWLVSQPSVSPGLPTVEKSFSTSCRCHLVYRGLTSLVYQASMRIFFVVNFSLCSYNTNSLISEADMTRREPCSYSTPSSPHNFCVYFIRQKHCHKEEPQRTCFPSQNS